MERQARHDVLFEPIPIGPKVLRNRLFQVPHCTGFGTDSPYCQAAIRATKAEGGWAAVYTETVAVHPEADRAPQKVGRIWDSDDVANLARMCEDAHEHGALAGVELFHPRMADPLVDLWDANVGAVGTPWIEMAPSRLESQGWQLAWTKRETIRTIFTPGHAPGHMSVLVTLPASGSVVLTADACYTIDHWEHRALAGLLDSARDAVASVDRLRYTGERAAASVVFGHDMDAWRAVRHAPEYYA